MFPKSGPVMALYHGLFAIKLLGKNLGILLERIYHAKSDRYKCRYTNTLPLRLIWIRPNRANRVFSRKQRSRELGGWKPLTRDIFRGIWNWMSVGNTQQQDFRRGGDLSEVSFLPKLLQSIKPRACKPLLINTQVRFGYPYFRQFYDWNQNIYRNEPAPNICVT